MSTTTTYKDLEKWLKATSLSDKEQMKFLNKFKAEGKWTPSLAENFAKIIITSMKTYEEDLQKFTSEMDKRANEIDVINKKMKARYKIGNNLPSKSS